MKRIITSLVAILLIIGSALGQTKEYHCTIDGVERLYKLHLPKGIKPEAPLVFVLHGYGSGIEHVLSKGFTEAADRHGFAVCYPQGSKDSRGNNCWNVGYPFQADMTVDDISFLTTASVLSIVLLLSSVVLFLHDKKMGVDSKKQFGTKMLIGGIVLHQGRIAEMKTGEGKTLVAILPCYLNALTGRGVHVVTVNDYLAKRDSEWMGKIYKFL